MSTTETKTWYARIRKGLIAHVRDGRMTKDEFAAFVMILICADHHTGVWQGSGSELASCLRIGRSKAHFLMRSLSSKRYIVVPAHRPFSGAYPVEIPKYFPRQVCVSGVPEPSKQHTRCTETAHQMCENRTGKDLSSNALKQNQEKDFKTLGQNLKSRTVESMENLKAAEKQIADAQRELKAHLGSRGAKLAFDEGKGQQRRIQALLAPVAARKAMPQ